MNIAKSTTRYEEWLRRHTQVVEPDLRLKHQRMNENMFMFLRATFYRWVQIWPEICSDLAKAPQVLAVGDLHVENFGTWRDIEGRLVWGVNDFDEAHSMSYANDLVRLAVSAHLAINENHLSIHRKDACEAILEGYQESLKEGGRPFVLGEHNQWLRDIAENELRDPVHFWKRMDSLPLLRSPVPVSATEALEHLMPEKRLPCKIVHRIAGLGSLGHQRYVALAEWRGGRIAREAKALVPSSCDWAAGDERPPEIFYNAVIGRAVRCADPFVQLRGRWIVRRLSPHCSRVELAALPVQRDELKLLYAMGWETANVHFGSRGAQRDILRHLRRQSAGWLHAAARTMAKAVEKDFVAWKREGS